MRAKIAAVIASLGSTGGIVDRDPAVAFLAAAGRLRRASAQPPDSPAGSGCSFWGKHLKCTACPLVADLTTS
jgi:hypothetical protein